MFRSTLLGCMLLGSVAFAGTAAAADEPTLHQVYQAAEAGRLIEAQQMMDQVLRDHPNSAKAHYVEAEILAKQGHLAKAETELATAERLAPGLPFAKADAVQTLKRRIASPRPATQSAPATATAVPHAAVSQPAPASDIPWALLLVGGGLVVAIIFFVRSLNRRNAAVVPAGGATAYGTGFSSAAPAQPYGPGGVAAPMGTPTSGIGSGILGGLATGAALGAGMVAGEALAHRLMDGNRHDTGQAPLPTATNWDAPPADDFGGSDFGIADGSSWDDGGAAGGGDWDS